MLYSSIKCMLDTPFAGTTHTQNRHTRAYSQAQMCVCLILSEFSDPEWQNVKFFLKRNGRYEQINVRGKDMVLTLNLKLSHMHDYFEKLVVLFVFSLTYG